MFRSTLRFSDNLIVDNTGADEGGGIRSYHQGLFGGSSLFERNRIFGNIANQGGGVWAGTNDDGQETFVSNVIAKNVASEGAGVYARNPNFFFINNTITENVAGGLHTILNNESSKADVYNNIIWNNT